MVMTKNVLTETVKNATISMKRGPTSFSCGVCNIGQLTMPYCKSSRKELYIKMLHRLKEGKTLDTANWGAHYHGCYLLSDCAHGESNYNQQDKEGYYSIYEMMTKYGKEVLGDQLTEIGPIYNTNSAHPIFVWAITTDSGKQQEKLLCKYRRT